MQGNGRLRECWVRDTDHGNLYVVATPIGNLEDITLRALRVLSEVGLIAAEDTRVTRRLLDRYDIGTPLTSYNEHNSHAKTPTLLAKLATDDVALVTDAGSPGINDPGRMAGGSGRGGRARGSRGPRPSAPTAALSVSGMYGDAFVYLGFLPKKRAERLKLLASVAAQDRTLVALETPHRLRDALQDIAETLGDRPIAVCRELTKLHEEVFRGTVSQAIERFQEPRGEFTLVIQGGTEEPFDAGDAQETARARLAELRSQGAHARDAVPQVGRRDRPAEAAGVPHVAGYGGQSGSTE